VSSVVSAAPELTETVPPTNGDDGTAPAAEPDHTKHGKWFPGRWKLGSVVAIAAAIIAAVGGAIGILFELEPGLSPCLGGPDATFTGAPVFPHYPYRRYLIDEGTSQAVANRYPNVHGAEVRYSLRAADLRGQDLVLRVTLVRIAHDGTVAAADTNPLDNDDLAIKGTFTPEQCSQTGGGTIFVNLPAARGHYQVVLELFMGKGLQQRVALGETSKFEG
jgi:hypothetical protein